ncbi:hypothetical protein Ahy_A05g024401 [Arachis hypogaea]|uniref:Retrotransposon gag domain-containing protein n=1 Tax=Arachis hypogaea TaxID=3818 RepID=A0A445D5P7_ARAHY|nr:hypothetical protein Ahy_A05g024401 [Arachis hypogaea]
MIEYYNSDDEGSSYAKKSSQFQIPAFKGRNDPEAYFRWERQVESIFVNCILSEAKKVQLVQANFSNAARIWWTELGRFRRWSPEILMERFLFGLREELADTVQCYRYTTMEDLVKLAIGWQQVQQMRDRQKKRISSTTIFHSSSKPEMEESVEYAVDGFVDLLVNYGGINRDKKKGRQIVHFGQDGENMVGKIELAHMKDIATIQWVENSHQTMVLKPKDWVWIPWRDEEHLIQDLRTNLFEEGENDTWLGGHFSHLRAKGRNDNLAIFKDLNSRTIVPCQSWTSRRPRFRLKNSDAERTTIHKAHWAKSGQQEAQ